MEQIARPKQKRLRMGQIRKTDPVSVNRLPRQIRSLKAGTRFRTEIRTFKRICEAQKRRPVPLWVTRIKYHRFCPVLLLHPVQILHNQIIRFFPGNPLKLSASPLPDALHRIQDPLLIIKVLL